MPLERTAEHILFCVVLVLRRGTAAMSGCSTRSAPSSRSRFSAHSLSARSEG